MAITLVFDLDTFINLDTAVSVRFSTIGLADQLPRL